MTGSLDEQFQAATTRAKGLPSQKNDTLLELYALYKQSLITWDDALHFTQDVEDLKRTFQREVG